MKRILMIAPRFWPAIGGVERHIERIVSILSEKGIETTLLTRSHHPRLPLKEKFGRIQVLRIPFPVSRSWLFIFFWMFRNHQKFSRFAIFHIHDAVPVLFCYLPLKLFFPTVPAFATFHGFEKDPVPVLFRLIRKAARRLVRSCLCVGRFIESIYAIRCDELTVGAVESNTIVPPTDREGLIFVGRLEPDTGILDYIEVVRILNEEYGIRKRLTICGTGSLNQQINKLASSKGVDIELRGSVPDVLSVIAQHEICLAAGYLSILEAMSLGLPVVGIAKTPLKHEYLQSMRFEGAPLSIRTTPAGVAKEIAKIISNSKLYEEISIASRAFATKQSWEDIAEKYVRIWRSPT